LQGISLRKLPQPTHQTNAIVNFFSLDISSLQNVSSLTFSGNRLFDCTNLAIQYAKIKNIDVNNQDLLNWNGFACYIETKPKFHLSGKGELGIGLGLGIPGLALLIWFFVWRVKNIKIEEARRKEWEGNRLPPYRLAALDRAPRYSHLSGTEQIIGRGADENTAHEEQHERGNEDDQSREASVDHHDLTEP
jgi:hypothetical protein